MLRRCPDFLAGRGQGGTLTCGRNFSCLQFFFKSVNSGSPSSCRGQNWPLSLPTWRNFGTFPRGGAGERRGGREGIQVVGTAGPWKSLEGRVCGWSQERLPGLSLP